MKHHINYANRGKGLETYIQMANLMYETRGIAIIKKIPTPIQVEKIGAAGKIIRARFEKGELVDFLGTYEGKAIAFDAKSTREKRFPLADLQPHQYKLLKQYHKQGSHSFLIVEFAIEKEIYLISFEQVRYWWDGQKTGGRKSIPFLFFQEECKLIKSGRGVALDYLAAL